MITQEQRNKYDLGLKSNLQWAKLDVDYYIAILGITLPVGTIVQVELYAEGKNTGDLFINGKCVTWNFPYDAATLLETEE